ncbi:MAG: DUF2577 family protein [Solibacillus sp.]
MMEEAREMAQMLKKRNNKKIEMLAIGEVVTTNPLKVTDSDGFLLEQNDELLITYHIQQLIQSKLLNVGDRVCLVSTSDYSKYIAIDKVVS